MLRPATLDRVENGGSGSDINPREGKAKGPNSTTKRSFRPVIIQSAAVLEAVKMRPGNVGVCLYGGATADLDSFCARRRRKSTVGAEESLRRGRTKESAKAKEEGRKRSSGKKARSWRRLENEKTGFQIEQRNEQRNEGRKMGRAC
jgi:hypothetical protein